MTNEYHKPFIKSMVLVAFVTVFAMISSKLIINSYFPPAKSVEYSSQKSHESYISGIDKWFVAYLLIKFGEFYLLNMPVVKIG